MAQNGSYLLSVSVVILVARWCQHNVVCDTWHVCDVIWYCDINWCY